MGVPPLLEISNFHLSFHLLHFSVLYLKSFLSLPQQSHIATNFFSSKPKRKHQTARATSKMASVSMAMPLSSATQNTVVQRPNSESFLKPLPFRSSSKFVTFSNPKSRARLQVQASLKEKAVTGLTAAALTASMVAPQVAEAAGPGISPSLKNFLLSIVAGGVVLAALVGAVIGVANFDPVKRS